MKISLIAAMSENRVIGNKGRLPWGSLPNDWKNLFEVTHGKKMIMGRKSYDTEDRIASEHGNVVITRQEDYQVESNFVVKPSIEAAIDFFKNEAEVFILGGGEIFKEAIKLADTLHLTIVHEIFEGDAFFPEFSIEVFELKSIQKFTKDSTHSYDYTFEIWERKKH